MSILGTKETSFAQAQSEIAARVRDGRAFLLQGNGSSRIGVAEGAPLTAPSGVWDYDPNALTLTVAAGETLASLQDILAQGHQRLAFEPPDLRAVLGRGGTPTIGGVVAGNLSGPRRVGVGACRDFCLGVGFVDGRGQVIKNGGRVMKNVTGLDLVKLMAGSQGTLGLITEVSLKTQPIPECSATLVISGLSDADAVRAMSMALGTPFDVTGAAHLRAGEGRTMIRLEGFENSLRYRMKELEKRLSGFGDLTVDWEAATNTTLWQNIRDVTALVGKVGDVWRVAIEPSKAASFVANIDPIDVIYDWGGNRIWLLTPPGTEIRKSMTTGHATLIRASDEVKSRLGVFHPENAVVARLSEGLRRKFDPNQKFNRGIMS